MAIAGLTPKQLTFSDIGVDRSQQVAFDPLANRHSGGGTMQTLGQGNGDVAWALGMGVEDDGLGFGECCHDGSFLPVVVDMHGVGQSASDMVKPIAHSR